MEKRKSRSREGAWIEISLLILLLTQNLVAPVRERGLKSVWSSSLIASVKSLP